MSEQDLWFIISKETCTGRIKDVVAIQGSAAASTELKFWTALSYGSKYFCKVADRNCESHSDLINQAKGNFSHIAVATPK